MNSGGYVQIDNDAGFVRTRPQKLVNDQDMMLEREVNERAGLKQKPGVGALEEGSISDWKRGATVELREDWRRSQRRSRTGMLQFVALKCHFLTLA